MPTAVNYASLKGELETEKGFSSYGAIVEWLKKEHALSVRIGDANEDTIL